MILTFWIFFYIIFYTFFGYGILLYFLVRIKRVFKKPISLPETVELSTVSVIIAAYDEEDLIEEKINNCLSLNYPENKLQLIFITDGSSDRTPDIVRNYSRIK